MATCEEIKSATRHVCSSSVYPGWLDLSPPVRFCNGGSGRPHQLAYMLNEETQQVMLVGETEPRPIGPFRVSDRQGRLMQIEIPDALLDKLERFLNRVSDERQEEKQTPNAKDARDFLDEFGMERHKV